MLAQNGLIVAPVGLGGGREAQTICVAALIAWESVDRSRGERLTEVVTA